LLAKRVKAAAPKPAMIIGKDSCKADAVLAPN
jgi:hypothetical protein